MADSLTGALFAVEGIKDAAVILNGPTGCKFYHSAISDYQFPRELSFDPLNYPEEFYFGQPRIPCTYLDGYDYVYGSSEKLKNILRDIEGKEYNLLAVVNSPGAALIGDDLNGFLKSEVKDTLCFSIESTGFSGDFGDGFQKAVIKILESMCMEPGKVISKSVNLIGISIYNKYYEGNIKEIKRLLNLCGIEVISTLCAGDDFHTIKNSNKAALNVVLYPEYGCEIAKWMEKEYHRPYILCDDGLPIGFESTEYFIKNICESLEIDPYYALDEIKGARARSFLYISRFNSITGLPKGSSFSIRGEASVVYPMTKWLYTYLGMVPASIQLMESNYKKLEQKLHSFLENIGFEDVFEKSIYEEAGEIVFADGNTIAQLRLKNKKFTGIEIGLPSLGYIDLMPKTIMGSKGALMLVEQVLNGLQFL
jgi:nitrogenase molybdenum-iron protein alpha/beta subunit